MLRPSQYSCSTVLRSQDLLLTLQKPIQSIIRGRDYGDDVSELLHFFSIAPRNMDETPWASSCICRLHCTRRIKHDPDSDVSFPSSALIVYVGLVRDSFDS